MRLSKLLNYSSLAHKTLICDFENNYSAIKVQFSKGDIIIIENWGWNDPSGLI